ncbi:hypothetical protein [Actinoplanes sp. NPDC023714]|uniref:hypothetical protein n=1 Tax=Actinoplanes sp. NPDC023714 TaxID=3154322 RepID=UPI0033E07A9B
MVIDLDQPAEDRPAAEHARWRRRRRLIAATALLAVGGAAGAGGALQWQSHRTERDARSAVAVVAVPGRFGWTGQSTTSYTPEGEPRTVLHMTGRLSIVNAGPQRVRLRQLVLEQPGTTLYSSDIERWIEPLEASAVEVAADVQCQVITPRDAKLSLTVQTTDARVRTSPVAWDSRPWNGERQSACERA